MNKEERSSYWRGVIEKHVQSGISAAAFCKEHQINLQRFYFWRRRFKSESQTKLSNTFLELIPSSKGRDSGVRIRLDDRLYIELECGFDLCTLRGAIEALSTGEKKPCSR